jgi:alkylation response protein AidB-like acyl-CoA dehydrogenase
VSDASSFDRLVPFTEEHHAFRAAVREFVAREIVPDMERFREEKAIDRGVWRAAGDAGFLGFMMPEEHGGGGADDFRFNAVLCEELSRVAMAYASSFGIHTDVVSPYLLQLTTDEQKARWLPRFCSGEMITAIGMTEPGAGSDLAAIATTAKPVEGGWLVNGSKTFITNGYRADLVVTAVKTDPEARARGISLLAIEEGMPGFERGRKLDKVGQPEADTSELFFNDVFVPEENLIGRLHGGFGHMMDGLAQERLSAAISNVAHARMAFDLTLDYVKERKAFGSPVGSFQHNKFVMAELATELDVTQAYLDRCLWRHVEGGLDAVSAAKAKWWTAQVQGKVVDWCVQLFGGYGYMREYEVAQAWMDARVTRIWAGSNEIMKEIIGRSLGL